MEPFFAFCGVVVIALWSAAEVNCAVDGYVVPVLVGIAVFALAFLAAFRRLDRIARMLQGLAFGAVCGFALFRLVFLNTTSEADHLGAFICGLGLFGLEWAMLVRLKKQLGHDGR